MSRGRALATLLNLSVFGAFVWFVQSRFGWRHILEPLHAIAASTLALALGGMAASYAIRAARIYIAEREIPRGAYLACLRLILINNAANWLLPSRTGEASFPILMKRWFGVDGARATGILLWLRLLDLQVLATIAGVCAAAGWLEQQRLAAALLWLLAACAALAPILLFALRTRASGLLERRNGRMARLAVRLLAGVPEHIGGLGRDLALTWLGWSVKLAALGWALARLANLDLAQGMLGAIGGDLSTVLPVHAPGGFGTYEAGVLALLAPASSATAASPAVGSLLNHLLAAAVDLHLLVLTPALLAGGVAWLFGPVRPRPEAKPGC